MAALLIQTFLALQRAPLGFNADHVLTGFVLPPPIIYKTDAQRRAFYDALLERAAALPGVKQAALSSVIPLNGDSDTSLADRGAPRTEGQRRHAHRLVSRVVGATISRPWTFRFAADGCSPPAR